MEGICRDCSRAVKGVCDIDICGGKNRVVNCTAFKKKEENGMGKGTEAFKAIMKALGEGLAEGAKAYEAAEERKTEAALNLPTEITLGAKELRELRRMYPMQLEKIFKGKKVKLAEDPAVYRELSGFYPRQLEAIFGKSEGE